MVKVVPRLKRSKVPKSLNFLRDSSVAISHHDDSVSGAGARCGQIFVEETLSAGQNFIIFAIIQSLTFAAGVYTILAGVRMVIAEIVPAFKGIADKLVKDAKPALDCPTVFPFARMPSSSASSQLCRRAGQYVPLPAVRLERHGPGPGSPLFCGATAGFTATLPADVAGGGGRGFCPRSAHFVPACHSLAHDGGIWDWAPQPLETQTLALSASC